MNKKEFIKEVSKKAKVKEGECHKVLSVMTCCICDVLNKGGSVYIAELGKFEVKTRAERRVINPQTMREMFVLPKKVPVLRCSKRFKSGVIN